MRLTQGAFSFLPDLTDQQILKQVETKLLLKFQKEIYLTYEILTNI